MTHGDEFVVTLPANRLADLKNKVAGVYPIKNKEKDHPWVNGKHQSVEQKSAPGHERSGVSARFQTCRRARERSRTRTWQLGADAISASRDGRCTRAIGSNAIQQLQIAI